MTPKSLLRNKRCISNIEDFSKKNSFHRVLTDHADIKEYGLIELKKDKKIKKVIICSGKVYFDLLESREKAKNDNVYFISLKDVMDPENTPEYYSDDLVHPSEEGHRVIGEHLADFITAN